MQEVSRRSVPSLEIPAAEKARVNPEWLGLRALMQAVLEDAINKLDSPIPTLRAEEERWIMSRESSYVFSFAVICETLDLDPVAVRQSVTALLGQTRTHARLLERCRSNVHAGRTLRSQIRHRVSAAAARAAG